MARALLLAVVVLLLAACSGTNLGCDARANSNERYFGGRQQAPKNLNISSGLRSELRKWVPATADVAVVQRVFSFLEDRRVLYTARGPNYEDVEYCTQSVLQIRSFLTEVIGSGGLSDDLTATLKSMRSACRTFLDEVDGRRISQYPDQAFTFGRALGTLRATFGMYIAQLAARYQLDVDDSLAQILPEGADE